MAGYLMALARAYPRFRPFQAGITLDGRLAMDREVFMLTVGNGPTCGGGFRLTPDADPSDGSIDLTVLDPVGTLPLLWHLPKVFLGTIERAPYSTLERFANMEIETDGPLPLHLDGEPLWSEGGRIEIKAMPGALKVIAGPLEKSRKPIAGPPLK